MSSGNFDPGAPQELLLTEVRENQFLGADELAAALSDVQGQITRISMSKEEELTTNQGMLAMRVAHSGTNLAMHLLRGEMMPDHLHHLTPEGQEELAERNQLVIDQILNRTFRMFDTLAHTKSKTLADMGARAKMVAMSTSSEYLSANDEELAAYLGGDVLLMVSIMGMSADQPEGIRPNLEDYSTNLLELINILAQKRGGLLLNDTFAHYLRSIGQASDFAKKLS